MNKTALETVVGVFVLLGVLCTGYMAVKLGKMDLIGNGHYNLSARFLSVAGLKAGAEVEIAGVPVAKVAKIRLDPERQVALVDLRIREGVKLTDDVIASVKTSGLIGDKYIKLSPGGSDTVLKDGDTIIETESAIDLEELISKYVFGGV